MRWATDINKEVQKEKEGKKEKKNETTNKTTNSNGLMKTKEQIHYQGLQQSK